MDLQAKFHMTNVSSSVAISSLEIGRAYGIVHAERTVTKYGPTINLALAESQTSTIKVFLPKRYSSLFTDEDIVRINTRQKPALDLVFRGTCTTTGAHIVDVQNTVAI